MYYKSLFLSIIGSMIMFASCSDSEDAIKSSEKEIVNFKIENIVCTIQGETIKIQIDSDMPTVYTPKIEVSPKATIAPKSGTEIDFKEPVTFTVTAEDGSFKTYKTELLVNQKLSSEKEILNFSVEGFRTEIKDSKLYINAYSWQTLYGLPVLKVSDNATVSPVHKEKTMLSWINKFTVTAEDGSQKEYPVVCAQADGISEIKVDFSSGGTSRMRYIGVFDEKAKTITIDYNRETNSTYTGTLVIATRGTATTNIQSGISLDEIPSSIAVTTKDGTVTYTLRVRNVNNYIGKINIPVVEGIGRFASNVYPKYRQGLDDSDICIFALENQNLKNLTPTSFAHSYGATVSPLLTSPKDFSKDVVYTVTSQSGLIREVKVRTIARKIIVTDEHNTTGSTIINDDSFFVYYKAIGQVSRVDMVNIKTGEVIPCTLGQQQVTKPEISEYYMVVYMSKKPTTNTTYYMRTTLPDGSVVNTDAKYTGK